jgi:hypothetical protein
MFLKEEGGGKIELKKFTTTTKKKEAASAATTALSLFPLSLRHCFVPLPSNLNLPPPSNKPE